jgi:hypothetical protein
VRHERQAGESEGVVGTGFGFLTVSTGLPLQCGPGGKPPKGAQCIGAPGAAYPD